MKLGTKTASKIILKHFSTENYLRLLLGISCRNICLLSELHCSVDIHTKCVLVLVHALLNVTLQVTMAQ